MATWVVQANLLSKERQQDVAWALKDLNIPYVGVNVIPFSDDLEFLFEQPTGRGIIPYGSTSLIRHAQRFNWSGLFFPKSNFNIQQFNKNRDDMLNSDAIFMTVAEAANAFSSDDREMWFMRPVEDLKAFSGTVTTGGEISRWMSSIDAGNFQISEDTVVAISQPKEIIAEWRWFVVGGKVVDGSVYKHGSGLFLQHEDDQAVIDEAQGFADKWLPHETVVMDIGLTNYGPKVIEFNCFNGSGFYKHNLPKIVSAATEYLDNKVR
jgi:hypothetical protein